MALFSVATARKAAVSDADLLSGCLRGAPSAERGLFERFGPVTLAICRRYGADRMEAEDFHQLSWIRAFERLAMFNERGSLEGWLRKLTVNVCLAEIRARRRRDRWTTALPEDDEQAPARWEDLDFLAEERLLELIDTLPEGARLVFNLFAVEGFDHAQIAEALSISEANSRQQLMRARQLLARRINPAPVRTPVPQPAT